MAVVYPKVGRERDLSTIEALGGAYFLRLFKNDITPDLDTELGDLVEADFSGYAAAGQTFGSITINADDNAECSAPTTPFIHNGGVTANDIYGWYLEAVFGGPSELMYLERFEDAPRVMDTNGDEIDVTITLEQGGCPA